MVAQHWKQLTCQHEHGLQVASSASATHESVDLGGSSRAAGSVRLETLAITAASGVLSTGTIVVLAKGTGVSTVVVTGGLSA